MYIFDKQKKISTVFRLTSIILSSKDLIENGVSPNIQSLLLVSFATTYLPAIIVSSASKPFVFTCTDGYLYAAGLCLSLILYNKEGFLHILKVIPNLSKCISTFEKIRSSKPIEKIIIQDLVSDFVGMVIKKTILKQKLVIKTQDMYSILIHNFGIYIIRKFRLPDISIVILVYWFSIYSIIISVFMGKKIKKNIIQKNLTQSTSTIQKKAPRRKASVTYMLENKAL